MKLSIIIPAYNRKKSLCEQLKRFQKQVKIDKNDFEIIVVDDGSDDGTGEFLKNFSSNYNLKIVTLQRTDSSSRSGARNAGAKIARGDILSFVDSGILPSNTYIYDIIEYYQHKGRKKDVLLHYTYGLFAEEASFCDENFVMDFENIRHSSMWRDVRADIFQHLKDIPAPWSLGWTCMYSVMKEGYEIVGGFDESFIKWGGEDSEFSLKLYENKYKFIFANNIYGIHIPHGSSKQERNIEKIKGSLNNRRKIFDLHPNFQTELYTILPSQILNQVINIFNSLTVGQVFQNFYSEDSLCFIQSLISRGNSLVVGIDDFEVINKLSPTSVFFFNDFSYNTFKNKIINKYKALGILTKFENFYFEDVIVSDFIRSLPRPLLKPFFKEMYRISTHLYILYTTNYCPTFSQIFQSTWHDIENLREILNELDLDLFPIKKFKDCVVFEIGDSRKWYYGDTTSDKERDNYG